jgi:hypothetical protein
MGNMGNMGNMGLGRRGVVCSPELLILIRSIYSSAFFYFFCFTLFRNLLSRFCSNKYKNRKK